jgi:hypothetical protein
MPMLKRADAEIHYEVHGAGFPVLLYAPGGLKSEVSMWGGSSPAYPNGFPWMDPRKALSDKYTVIAMEREIAELAPNIEVQKDWRGPEFLHDSIRRVHAFLAGNTPP